MNANPSYRHSTMAERRDARGGGYAVLPRPQMRNHNMTVEEAGARLRRLVKTYGLHWTRAPSSAYIELAAINTVLDEDGRRKALGLE